MHMQAVNFDRFVRALHRRFLVVRGLERIGGAMLIGCGASLLLLPLAMWRSLPTMALIWLVLGCCGGMGLLAGLLWRPTRLDAAMEADRQLRLADLLSSALSVRAVSDPWTTAVV